MLMVSGLCHAQYSNHQLYQAYLNEDISLWGEYIASAQWNSMSVAEKKQLLNYEYGYAAVVLGADEIQAKVALERYEQHIEAMKDSLPEAKYYAYLASLYTYRMGVEKGRFISHAKNLFACINHLKALDADDALAFSMMGNVEFYAPSGSKKKALAYFQKADSLYNLSVLEYEQWNHHAVKRNIEQCLDKLKK